MPSISQVTTSPSLCSPGQSAEQLLEVITYRRADGREIALDQLPLAGALSGAETVRAEEIVLTTLDGRSITTLINATPIHAEDGAVASVVVTMQDLAPLEELERQRAEFLGMVSHELRVPLTSIKGSTGALLGSSRQFAPAETREFIRIVDDQADRMIGLIADLLDAGRIDTGTLSVSPEPSEVAALVDRARTTFLSGGARHTVTIDLPPDLPRVMADRQRVEQVLNNLLANAARQAPESSPIRVAAECDGVHVAVSVADEGRGIAPERLAQLFRKYSGGADGGRGAGTGGAGLGLAICKGLVEAHGGRIRAESGGVGLGARFTFTLPVAGEAGAGAPGPAPGIAPAFGFGAGFSRASIAVASREMCSTGWPSIVRAISVSCRRLARPLSANSEKARENVASLGSRPAPLQPHSRQSLPSTSRRSIGPRVVGTSNTALAMKARASAARSSSGRPAWPRK